MTIKRFIEAAIEGGWDASRADVLAHEDKRWAIHEKMLLDPEAWKAVGKVEKGAVCICGTQGPLHTQQCPCVSVHERAAHLMHAMIDALADGKTIEQYLETL